MVPEVESTKRPPMLCSPMTFISLLHVLPENVFYMLKALPLTYVSISSVIETLLEADGSGRLCPCTDKATIYYLTGDKAARHQFDKVI